MQAGHGSSMVTIAIGYDTICEIAIEEGEDYVRFAQHWMRRAYPNTAVNVSFKRNVDRDRISIYCESVSAVDVCEALKLCWSDFCYADRQRINGNRS